MEKLNSKVVSWLENGYIKEALTGEKDYFINNNTYTSSHDLILVIDVMIEWAYRGNCIELIGSKFHDAVLELSKTRQDICADVLISYSITVRDSKKPLPCNLWDIYEELCKYLQKCNKESECLVNRKILMEVERLLLLVQPRNK